MYWQEIEKPDSFGKEEIELFEELDQVIFDMYRKFKFSYYHRIFRNIKDMGDDALSAIETFCVEAIMVLNKPTLTQFANFIDVSMPNATYKINSLEKKGFVRRVKCEQDARVVHLHLTDKYAEYYGSPDDYVHVISRRIVETMETEDVLKLGLALREISGDIMVELNDYISQVGIEEYYNQ